LRLSELIRGDLVKIGLEADDKWEAIEELVDLLISTHELSLGDRHDVVEAVFARERSLSTGLEHGIAVPYGEAACVDGIVAALGTSEAGIPFESLDNKPAHLIVLIIIPQGAFQRHVRTLTGIAHLGADAELRKRICKASSPEAAMNAIYKAEEAQVTNGC